MPFISISDLAFRYAGSAEALFQNLNLEIDCAWKSALIGRNGRGKTTLFQLIAGNLTPDKGEIRSDVEITCFPFSVSDPDTSALSGLKNALFPYDETWKKMEQLLKKADEKSLALYGELEELYQFRRGYEIEDLIIRESKLMKIEPSRLDQNWATLSPGEKTQLLITGLFLFKNNYPLIDEPSNHLDRNRRILIAEYLAQKKGFLCVSHDRELLDICCDHVIALEKSGVSIVKGNYSVWEKQFNERLDREEQEYEKIQKETKKLKRAARLRQSWSNSKEKEKLSAAANKINNRGYIGHKAAKMMKQSLLIQNRIEQDLEKKESLLKDKIKRHPLKMFPIDLNGKELFRVDNLSITFGNHTIVRNFNLYVYSGERIAIVGPNGSGKSSVLKTILGEISTEASVKFMPEIQIVYSSQLARWNKGTIEEHLGSKGIDLSLARNVLATLGVLKNIRGKKNLTFSEGERKMIELCPSFIQKAHLFIWDEPLNYLDISTRSRIESAILKYRPTLLFVEHDRYFINKVATRIIELK